MDIPRFERESLNRRLVPGELGDAFQRFSGDVLRVEYPGLHTFPTAGKDGGIDHVDSGEARTVFECKLVGEDSYRRVEQAWQEVARLLERHLANPAGPTPGQAQYGPWYRTDPPIARYVLVTSAEIANLANRDEVRDTIRGSFRALAARHAHLAHLAAVEVETTDWADLVAVLRWRPHLVFRWFPVARPGGLVPLDESPPVGTFRSYLDSSKLPYYSLAGHLASHGPPQGVRILAEADLLAALEPADTSGMIIHGAGGVGKTRLSLELGRMALDQGWTVLRVDGRLRPGALDRLAEGIDPKTPALLVIDYVETQGDFAELVEDVNLLNDAFSLRIRYVASCRSGYYPVVEPLGRHKGVDLSPPPGDAARQWLEDYRQATVRHILGHTGIQVTQQHLEACHQNPVLAVFMAYLHAAGRHEDLAELLGEEDFGRWVAKRVQLSFQTSIGRELALLMTLFPMSDDAARGLSGEPFRPLFDRLGADGWIEPSRPEESAPADLWRSAHDVLADQIVLSYVRTIPATAGHFIDEVLNLAASTGCLDSALGACRRLARQPPLSALNLKDLLREPIREWVTQHATVPEAGSVYEDWLEVRWEEDLVREPIGAWLVQHGTDAEARSVYRAWLDAGGGTDLVREPILAWLEKHGTDAEARSVYRAWLDAGGDMDFVREPIRAWLAQHGRAAQAQFVYKGWLDAGGEKDLVRSPIGVWLVQRGMEAEAAFLYVGWLDAGGEMDLVREPIGAWLEKHGTDPEAQFVYQAWLDAGGEWDLVREPMRNWVSRHVTTPEAEFIYQHWLDRFR